MTGKNSEIRFRCVSQLKAELDILAHDTFNLKRAETYAAVTELGLDTFKKAITNGNGFKLEHLPNNSTKKIILTKSERGNKKK